MKTQNLKNVKINIRYQKKKMKRVNKKIMRMQSYRTNNKQLKHDGNKRESTL